jgi:hypothetical protein
MTDSRRKPVSPKLPAKADRRQFINAAGASLAVFAGAPELVAGVQAAQASPQPGGSGDTSPDLIVINAKVYTMDPRFAARGGLCDFRRTLRCGRSTSDVDVRNLAGKNTQTFDAKGTLHRGLHGARGRRLRRSHLAWGATVAVMALGPVVQPGARCHGIVGIHGKDGIIESVSYRI